MRGQTARIHEIDVPDSEPRTPPPRVGDPPAARPTTTDADPGLGSASDLDMQIAGALIVLALLLAR